MARICTRGLLLQLIGALLVGTVASAQRTFAIPSEPSCVRCRLELELIATLGEDPNGPIPSRPSGVLRDRHGRYLVSFYTDITEIFDSAGRHIGPIGRRGRGPGEFDGPQALTLARGDSILAIGYTRGTISVLDPSGRFVRSEPMPMRISLDYALALDDGTLILSGEGYTPSSAGYGLHIVRNGNVERSYALGEDRTRTMPPQVFIPSPALSRDSNFWVISTWPYRVERHSADGRVVERFLREPDWYEIVRTTEAATKGPPSAAIAVRELADGRLVTAVIVRAERWQQHMPRPRAGSEVSVASVNLDGLFDSVIELLDPRSRRLVASARVPHYVFAMPDAGLLASYTESADGVPLIQIWRVHLQDRGN